MARPVKKSLHYFPFDVDFYDDYKIMDLMNMYGPIGVTIYQILLCEIYKEGYYLEVPLEKLAIKIVRAIGNRWVKDKNFVMQVILSCADIGLLNDALLTQGVITSEGLQRRYSEATVRNKVSKDKYWLIDESEKGQPLLNAPETEVFATETEVFATETPINATEIQQKESKRNKIKLNSRDRSFLTQDQYNSLVNEFSQELIDDYVERTKKYGCCTEKTIRQWIEEDTANINSKRSANRKKNNFEQRDYDSEKLEKALLGRKDT